MSACLLLENKRKTDDEITALSSATIETPTAFKRLLRFLMKPTISRQLLPVKGVKEMAKKLTNQQRLALKLDTLNESEAEEVLDYISIMESMRLAKVSSSIWDDDIVSTLADSRENKRARQAYEWESVRRRAERKASAQFQRS